MSKKLIKVDKNGTKYWSHGCACQRCGGLGGSDAWAYTGWTCYECGGSGIGPEIISKEYTPEYEAKLAARRAKRQAKKDEEARAKSAEVNKEFFERQGFNEEGKTWAVLGKTYEIKEEIKSNGGKWMSCISRWTFNHPVEEYPTVELSVDDIYFQDNTFTYKWNYWKRGEDELYTAKIEAAEAQLNRKEETSEWFGEVGERYEMSLIFVRTIFIENKYRYGYWSSDYDCIHIFKDEKGNEYVWKTSSTLPDAKSGQVLSVKGTVKEHKEYKGKKQTALTRCKISEEEK